ncbi:MAG TPA: LytR C-terminal domain-containing protein [Gemmatimonadales bacterium]|nr:LytR C-terminal domain-containing protein [Gemmatimonadales bacterium]
MALPQIVRSRAVAVLGVLVAFAAVAFLIRAGERTAQGDHLYPVPEGEDRIEVEVLNATGKAGIARVGTRTLRRQGVDVVFFGNADTTADSTRLVLRRGSRERAEEVQKLLGTGKIEAIPDSTRRVDVTVIIGKDWKAPEELHP